MAAAPAPALTTTAPRIVGVPATTSIDQVPWQVAVRASAPGAASGLLCGGTIRDETHVVTAAHCVFSTPLTAAGQTLPAAWISVKAGASHLDDAAPAAPAVQVVGVSAVSFLRTYGAAAASGSEFADDAALLTLAAPLDLAGAEAKALPLVAAGASPGPGAAVTVSGFGGSRATTPTTAPSRSTATCAPPRCRSSPTWPARPTAATTTPAPCSAPAARASTPAAATAAARSPPRARWPGSSSRGPDPCGQAGMPGVYTKVAAAEVRAFLGQPAPAPAPRNTGAPAVAPDPPHVGDVLRCAPGSWEGATSFAYQVLRTVGPTTTADTPSTGTDAYTVVAADQGASLRCVVTASSAGGAAYAESARTAPVQAGIPPAAAAAPAVVPPAARVDRLAPTTKVSDHRCRRARCRVDVRVTDPGVSRGVRTVQASVTTSSRHRCRRHGRRTTCTRLRTRTVRASRLTATRFRIVLTRLTVGRHVLKLRAIDVAGHQQVLPTRLVLRTRRAH